MPQPSFVQPKKAVKVLKEPHPQFLNNAFADPYSGCEMGCAYCYGVKEDIIDNGKGPSPFRVGIKTSGPSAFKTELAALNEKLGPNDAHKSIGLGFATDPYQPVEAQYLLTQRYLELARENPCPIQIITKSELVLRDKDILRELSEKGLAVVSVSLFSLNRDLSEIFEPRAPAPAKRLDLIRKLRNENIVAGAYLMPIFPYLSDSDKELDEAFSEIESHGALYCVPGILNLSQEASRKRVFSILKEKFSRTYDQYEALYDKLGQPALNYCERLEKNLRALSEKHHIPTVLPVESLQGKQNLIVKDKL